MQGRQPTIFLHIGIAKTGTTYLQEVLWHNRRLLDQHGLRYPGDRPGDHFRASVDLRQKPFAGEAHTLQPGAWDALARAAKAAPDRAVISHETLTRATTEQVQRAVESLQPAELHLVVTVRDLARQLPAVWQEHLKNRGVSNYDRFLRDVAERPRNRRHRNFWQAQDLLDVLRRWSAAAPPERVHLVTVPQPGAPSGLLWERFASVLGVEPGLVRTDLPVSNVSLGVAEAELLRRLNPALRERVDWPTYERHVKSGLVRRLAARRDTARLQVPVDWRAWVSNRAEQMVAGLREGGYDVVGDLDELVPVFDDRPVVMPRDIPSKQLLQMAGECFADLLGEHAAPGRGMRYRLRNRLRAVASARRAWSRRPGSG
jgi:hypothetical protein